MVKLTCSLWEWLFRNGYKQEAALIGMGHVELFTPEMQEEYLKWVQTDEAKPYLKGGEKYYEC